VYLRRSRPNPAGGKVLPEGSPVLADAVEASVVPVFSFMRLFP